MTTDKDRNQLGELIKRYCQVPSPNEEFVQSLAARARQELTRALQEPSKAAIPRAQRGSATARRLKTIAIAVAAVAAVFLIGVWLWIGAESRAWAQVVNAVRAKPWVHGVSQATEGTDRSEMWFSMRNTVAAARYGKWAVYDDGRSGIRQEYDPKQNEVFQTLPPGLTEKQIRSMQAVFACLFRGSKDLGPDFAGVQITKQERRRLADHQREWIEYSLTVEPGARRLVFRVDPQTRLPQSMELFDGSTPPAEAKSQIRYVLDYPEEGPVDIYSLGVPRSAKVITRLPTPDLARVIDAVKTGRQRFADSYYAIVAETYDLQGRSDQWWQTSGLHRVWCKGDRWRVEDGLTHNMQRTGAVYMPAEPPGAGVDKMVWWKEHLKDFDFGPAGVCDGKAIYAPKRASPGAQVTPEHTVWETWKKITPDYGRLLQAASFGPASAYMPELYAYPPLLQSPNRDLAVELVPNPSDPPGSVLVKYSDSRQPNRSGIRQFRFWVDPARSYVTLRYELGEAVDAKAGPEAIWPDTYVADELSQAPSGIWYATVVRRKWPGKVASPDKRGSTAYWFFVDFKAHIPDTLY